MVTPELTFVTFDPRVKIQSATVRKTVRSHAAKAAAPLKKKALTAKQRTHIGSKPPLDNGSLVRGPAPPRQRQQHAHDSSQTPSAADGPLADRTSRKSGSPSNAGAQMSDGSGDATAIMLREPIHPVLLFQPLLRESFSPLLNDYYLANMAVCVPDLDAGYPGLLRNVWYPFALMHDGLLHIIFLLAGASYLNSRSMDVEQKALIRSGLNDLKSKSLSRIHRMIKNSDLRHGDASIAAVSKMASYESIFGTYEAYCIHMRALKKMVAERGGIPELGLQGLLGRMILWIDFNAACLLNKDVFFVEESAWLSKPMEFAPALFAGVRD